jgi:hypothetical protein
MEGERPGAWRGAEPTKRKGLGFLGAALHSQHSLDAVGCEHYSQPSRPAQFPSVIYDKRKGASCMNTAQLFTPSILFPAVQSFVPYI